MDKQYNDDYRVTEYSMKNFPERKIYCYDNLFSYSVRTHIYEMCTKSVYKICGTDNGVMEYKNHVSVVSTYNLVDFEATELIDSLPPEVAKKHQLTYENVDNTMINLCTPADRFHTHIDNDSNGWTMVYYANLKWDVEWGGDTCFLNEQGDDFEFVSAFKPGRLVLFHPQIPHLIRPPTQLAAENGAHFRFTLATKFIPKTHPQALTDASL